MMLVKLRRLLVAAAASSCVLVLTVITRWPTINTARNSQLTSDMEAQYRMKGPLSYDDSSLLQLVRHKYLMPPATEPYNLREVNSTYGNYEQMTIFLVAKAVVLHYFKNVKNGTFVEAGALDGQFLSNTLYLEKNLGWTGLLVEPGSLMFQRLVDKRRKAWLSNTCVATKPYPHKSTLGVVELANPMADKSKAMEFHGQAALLESRTANERFETGLPVYEEVQCVPLATLMLAANITRADYISLDVEDVESDVIDNFPFDRIQVDVWYVEHREPTDGSFSKQKFNQTKYGGDEKFIRKFTSHGYRNHILGDYIFVRIGSKYDSMPPPKPVTIVRKIYV